MHLMTHGVPPGPWVKTIKSFNLIVIFSSLMFYNKNVTFDK